jgi:hypothetical protein
MGISGPGNHVALLHLALAALREISWRSLADSALALAGPPALPPLRASLVRSSGARSDMRDVPPRAPISERYFRTAAGVGGFGRFGIGMVGHPMIPSTTDS